MHAYMPRILVVEDEALVRLALCDFLESSGFRVLEACDGDRAVEVINRAGAGIDLVFTDVRMPGSLDGFALANWIHKHEPKLPVVITSGDIGKVDMRFELAPGEKFLPKPYSFDRLVGVFMDTLEAVY